MLTYDTQRVIFVLLGCCVMYSTGCFIRNCPPGGKRSLEEIPNIPSTTRRCLSCGPLAIGQCVGPNICCGATIGCYINTRESQVCERENQVTTPCEIDGKSCSGGGKCVSDRLCCTDESCTFDDKCDFSYRKRSYVDTLSFLRSFGQPRYKRSNH